MKKTTIITESRKCDEYHAVFSYRDMEKMLVHLMVDRLVEDGRLAVPSGTSSPHPHSDYPWLRVESRLCEPDGDMGWPGFAITLMVGDSRYYPKTLEGIGWGSDRRRKMGNLNLYRFHAGQLRQERPALWKRLLGLLRPRAAKGG